MSVQRIQDGVRLLRARDLSVVEQAALRSAIGGRVIDALREGREADLRWWRLRQDMTQRARCRLTSGEASLLATELHRAADRAAGEERRDLLALVRRWRVRARQ
jgi:hypothetical protein